MKLRTWTAKQESFVIANYEQMTAEQIAKGLGKTLSSVYSKIHALNLSVGKKEIDEAQPMPKKARITSHGYLVKKGTSTIHRMI